ncbi:sulfide:quinone oxidoreductase [Thioclava sp. ES.031]|uniref:TIGR01244 family sulfur transferase n=1 Tax=Thioclava sp. ES.031 TaxID=1798203 RepID=UPI000BF7A2C3|nr:TIGR01244 family sulfur transferase [Thioclava sp. ES.031]PFG63340.1 sulfide:quinone oxidoreductase [Thioclava sp. ES.031]
MEPRKLSDDFSVSPQIEPEDVAKLAEMGFRTLITNRPDEEVEDDKYLSANIAKLCAQYGLNYHYLPYYPGEMTFDLVHDYEAIMNTAPKPAFGYCRSGTRSSHLWGMSQAGRMDLDKIIEAAANAGYDHSSLMPVLKFYATRRGKV